MEIIFSFVVIVVIFIVMKKDWSQNQYPTKNKPTFTPKNEKAKHILPTDFNSRLSMVRTSSNVRKHDSDDDFGNFVLSDGYRKEQSSNKQKGVWIQPNETIKINGRTITKGFIYVGGVLPSKNGSGLECSLIDESLKASSAKKIDNVEEIYTDQSLSYWPSYSTISKECRGVLLDWLVSDRSNPNMPIGYVFLYFYGLERRIVIDLNKKLVSDDEVVAIYHELTRLNQIYESSRSFINYSNGLKELILFYKPDLVGQYSLELPKSRGQLVFKLELGKTVKEGRPVSSELAFLWLKGSDNYRLKTPARRCEDEFIQLFSRRYQVKFGDGIKVKPNKTKLEMHYGCASSTLGWIELHTGDLPDASILSGPINKFIVIADKCTQELEAYSRYLGKKDTSKDDIAALMLLPDELINEETSPTIKKFKEWAEHVVANANGLVSVDQFWKHVGTVLPKVITKKENELLYLLSEKAGFGIAPDIRFHNAKLKPDGNIVLFDGGHGAHFEPRDNFHQAQVLLRLGAMVANADKLDDSEYVVLRELVDHDTALSPTEKKSLQAYLTWRLNTQANMNGMKAKLDGFKANQKDLISRFIISIALADGVIDASEIKQIEKIYTLLGLDKSVVTNDIHALATEKVKPSHTKKVPQKDELKKGGTFNLDMAVLSLHENETGDVKSLLNDIFKEQDDVELPQEIEVSSDTSSLDSNHQALYLKLIEQEKWSIEDVQKLCADLGLMVHGAIETINDWSFGEVDAPVLDEDGDIFVDLEIIEELKGQ